MADTQPTHPARSRDEDAAPKNDFRALILHVQTHPWTYIGAAAFIVLILIVTGIYRLSQRTANETAAGEFARALDIEDAKQRAEALGKIADKRSALSSRALYMQGESMLEAGDYDGAAKAFKHLRESYPDYEFVPEAVEGLGLIQEDAGNFSAARGIYEEVVSKWPNSVAAQRQPFNIARCFEGEKNMPSAIEKYRAQLDAFPGSTIAVRAQQRLDEIRAEHPELFPAETPPAVDTLKPAADAATPPAAAAPATETPAPPVAETAPAPAAPQQ